MTVHLIWKTLYWAWILTEVLVLVVTRTRHSSGEVQDRGSLIVLWFTIFGAMFVGSWVGAVYQPTMFGRGIGCGSVPGMLAVGLVIRWSAIYTLGKIVQRERCDSLDAEAECVGAVSRGCGIRRTRDCC